MSGNPRGVYPPRIQAFRSEIIKAIPRDTYNRKTLAHLEGMHTRRLILTYVTWQMRRIPAKPRTVKVWPAGIDCFHYLSVKQQLLPLLSKVESGENLTPHLSDLVNKKGFILPTPGRIGRQDDKDMVLTRMGLHHFHVGAVAPGNPKGRSRHLIFAEVTESDFTIIAMADHKVFEVGSPESMRFYGICSAYIGRAVPPGEGFMMNPVMSSGNSQILTMFSKRCEEHIQQLDPKLDDPNFVDQIYNGQPIERDGQPVDRPMKPSFKWHFDDLHFGILERKTRVFFCIFPYFTR